MKEQRLVLKKKEAVRMAGGYPLIRSEAAIGFEDGLEEGSLVRLEDTEGVFLARGYVGRQNKGLGWVLSRKEHEAVDEAFFYNRLATALGRRSRFFGDPETTAFRLFNGEGDGIGGLSIDWYGGYCLVHWYSRGIHRFREPIIDALAAMTAPKGIYEKKRFDEGGGYLADDDFTWGARADFPLVVREKGIRYGTYLNEGGMTGIFLDQREVRSRLKERYAAGKTVLNTFSYTGAFSVAAALGGAEKTVSVDLASRSLSRTREQFELNGLDPDRHEIIIADVFDYFRTAEREGRRFDVVVLDPPSFARSKDRVFRASKDYGDLVAQSAALLKGKGILLASTNCASLPVERFREQVSKGIRQAGASFRIREAFSLPPDFQTCPGYEESAYLKVVFAEVLRQA